MGEYYYYYNKSSESRMGRGMDWIDLAQDRGRLGGTCECGNETLGSIKCGEFQERNHLEDRGVDGMIILE